MITVLTSEDLNISINIDELTDIQIINLLTDFNYSKLPREVINKSSFIVFIADNRQFKILKNRYADDSPETYEILDLLKLN